MHQSYSTAEFEKAYTYSGNDLGAVWTRNATYFRVWAPTAQSIYVNLYRSGTEGTEDLIGRIPMNRDIYGTWVAKADGNQDGRYYTYLVNVDGKTVEACDPYARSTGVNGKRAMILDLRSTNPKDWVLDADPHGESAITDAVIYELHIRDLSMDSHGRMRHKGKFLGLSETGTSTKSGISTGLDHIKELGITHIHLLPAYDFGSVDESHLEKAQFNWGYDPVNYNVPEGSYSSDPFDGAVRVREMKQMIKGLHDNGISVILDVVYNHVYHTDDFCFN